LRTRCGAAIAAETRCAISSHGRNNPSHGIHTLDAAVYTDQKEVASGIDGYTLGT
jgi:hypothetical protein